MSDAFAIGPSCPLRFFKGGQGFVFSSKWVGEKDQVIRCGEVGISSVFSSSVRPGQLMTIGCGLTISSSQILSAPLLAFLKKGGMVKTVSP